jgi:integrase
MRLTKSVIDKATYPAEKAGGAFYLWHDDPRGLGVRIYPSGLRSWVLHYRHKGRRRFKTLGQVGVLSLHQARNLAIQTLGRLLEQRAARIAAPEAVAGAVAVTLKALGDRFLEERCSDIKAKTREMYDSAIRLHLYPALGHHPAIAVEREDVLKLRESLKTIPSTGGLALRLLNRMYEFGQEVGTVPVGTNPCQAIPGFKNNKRERYLSEEELARLAEAFRWVEQNTKSSVYNLAALRVTLLTGCRKNEIRTLKWSYVDFDNSCFRFPDSKTGAKVVPVGGVVLDLLGCLERVEGNEYVFPGQIPGQPVSELKSVWGQIIRQAGLTNIRIHDLRHTFATTACADGVAMSQIQKLLVHTQESMTRRYVHVLPSPSEEDRQAAEQVSRTLYRQISATG